LEIIDQGSTGLITEVGTSTSVVYYPGCKPDSMIVEAFLQQHPDGIESVVLRHRLLNTVDTSTTPWVEVEMLPQGILNDLERYGVELIGIGADAMSFLQGSSGVIEYQVMAQYHAGMSEVWPDDGASQAQIPVEVCANASWLIIEYGPDVEQAGYEAACSQTEVTFSIIVENAYLVDSGWLQVQYLAPVIQAQAVSPLLSVPLSLTEPAPGNPDATLFSATIDLATEAPAYMAGQTGFLAWNIYLQKITGEVFEFPQGGPPTVDINACGSAFSGVSASTDLFYYQQTDCTLTPNEVTLQVSVDDPAGIALVEVYFRAKIKSSGAATEWDSRIMNLLSDSTYQRTVNAGWIPEGASPFEAWFQYQFIATTNEGAFLRSEVFEDVSLQGCAVILAPPG
jgi:hypothetical protein